MLSELKERDKDQSSGTAQEEMDSCTTKCLSLSLTATGRTPVEIARVTDEHGPHMMIATCASPPSMICVYQTNSLWP